MPDIPMQAVDSQTRKFRRQRLKRLELDYKKVMLKAYYAWTLHDVVFEKPRDPFLPIKYKFNGVYKKLPKDRKTAIRGLKRYVRATNLAWQAFNYFDLQGNLETVEMLEISLEKFEEYTKNVEQYLSHLFNFSKNRLFEVSNNDVNQSISEKLIKYAKQLDPALKKVKETDLFEQQENLFDLKHKEIEKCLSMLCNIVKERCRNSKLSNIDQGA